VLPRDIADAHLSGSLHINNLGVWILKPSEFAHDLRYLWKHGFQFGRPQQPIASTPPPKSLEAALGTITNLLELVGKEVSGEQLLDYFNVFLAPFVKGVEADRIREQLRLFIINLNQTLTDSGQTLPISLGLETCIPDYLKEEKAIGPEGKKTGSYAEYSEETLRLASLILDIISEESKQKPLFQPSLIVKLRSETINSKDADPLLVLAHRLAEERGLPLFANLAWRKQTHASYSATGSRFDCDWKGDWELDTLRMGSVDSVLVNLPRLTYECEGNTSKFYELLDEQLEMAVRALEIKYQTVKLRGKEGLLPFLTHKAADEQYARFENFTRIISFIGLSEAVESLGGTPVYSDAKSTDLAEQIAKHVNDYVKEKTKKPESRPVTAMIPASSAARRLALLDVERYGWAKVHVKGPKDQPYYTDLVAVPADAKITLDQRLKIEDRIQKLTLGGHFTPIQANEDSDRLLAISKKLVSESSLGLYSFSRALTYCSQCRKIVPDQPTKCPSCGSVKALTSYNRVSAKYEAVSS
jgi:ribonucleoside-triphosphate reductase